VISATNNLTPAKVSSESSSRKVVAVLEAVTKVYQMGEAQVRALAGVTVAFDAGGFYAIMGASSASFGCATSGSSSRAST